MIGKCVYACRAGDFSVYFLNRFWSDIVYISLNFLSYEFPKSFDSCFLKAQINTAKLSTFEKTYKITLFYRNLKACSNVKERNN